MPTPLPRRPNSLRLTEYDYSQPGAYFVTIVTENRTNLFGHMENDQSILNPLGQIAYQVWTDLPNHYHLSSLEALCIMPNHLHGIVVIHPRMPDQGTEKDYSLSEIIRCFKTFSARQINRRQNKKGQPIWQPRFIDRIIRNEHEYENIKTYILNNPAQWAGDEENQK